MGTKKFLNCDDQYEPRIEDCKLKKPESMNFFSGQLLGVQDFNQEKNYFNEKRHLLNRVIHGSGIVCGLEINKVELVKENCICSPEGNVETISRWIAEVSEGVALDCLGREIIVNKTDRYIVSEEDPRQLSKYFGLYIKRKDHLKSPVPSAHVSSCEEICCYSRILEDFQLVFENLDQSIQIFFDCTTYAQNEQIIIYLIEPYEQQIKNRTASLTFISTTTGEEIKQDINLTRKETLADMSIFMFSSDKLQPMIGSKMVTEYDKSSSNSGEQEGNLYTSSAYIAGSSSGVSSGIVEKKRLGEDYYKVWLKKCICCENPNDAKVLLSVLTLGRESEGGVKKMEILEEETTLLRSIVYNNPMLYDLITKKPAKPSDGPGEQLFANTGIEKFSLTKYNVQTREVTHKVQSIDGSPPAIVLGLVGNQTKEVKYMEDMLLYSIAQSTLITTPSIQITFDGTAEQDLHAIFDDPDKKRFFIFLKAIEVTDTTCKIVVGNFSSGVVDCEIRWFAIPSKSIQQTQL
jgi:hypothetical protein